MEILIVYDSLHGNTEKIAVAMGEALSKSNKVNVVKVINTKDIVLQDYELIIIGSPTNGGQPTSQVKSFIDSIPNEALAGKNVATFATGTTMDGQGLIGKTAIKIFGYAGERIGKMLKDKGANLLSFENFLVKGWEGPIVEGEIERAQKWATSLV